MKIIDPPIKLCTDILEFLYEFQSRKKDCTAELLKKHFVVTPNYYSRAILFLKENGIIIFSPNDSVILTDKVKEELEKSSENSKKIVLEKLMEIQPFIEFTYFLGKGKSEKESIKLVCYLYNIDKDQDALLKVFREWMKVLNLNISSLKTRDKMLEGIQESLQNKLYANNFVKDFLGDYLHDISPQVVTELSDAIKEIPNDNEASLNESGRALEDFLRLDLGRDIDLTGCAGIAEIANELNRYPDFPKKLNNLCVGLSSVRSLGKAHGSDKNLKVPWNITDHGATGYSIMVLTVIKSYLVFKKEGKLIY